MRSLIFAAPLLAVAQDTNTATTTTTSFHGVPMDGCTDPDYGPVLAGVDFVDLQEVRATMTDPEPPQFGTPEFSAKLNNYTFLFKTAENQAKFVADPWRYAPIFGGF
jgi:hypothetical protein